MNAHSPLPLLANSEYAMHMVSLARELAGDIRCPSNPTRVGYGMHTFSGRWYFPFDPLPSEVFIADIASGLSKQCRFNGQCREFYTVAEHSYWCSFLGPDDEALERLMHDASEAYIGDMIRPMKMVPALREPFLKVEAANEAVIALRYNLRYPFPLSVKKADESSVTAEMEQNINNPQKGHLHDNSVVANITLQYWSPAQAEAMFLKRFHDLAGSRNISVF